MTKRRKPLALVEERIEVAASPEVLWTCFANLDKWPQWFPALIEAEWTSGTPWTVGAQFRHAVRYGFPLGRVRAKATIVEVSASPFVAWEGRIAGMDVIQGFRFDAAASGTEVLTRHEFYGFLAIPARLLFLTRRVRKTYRAALKGFKDYVEAGTVQSKPAA
jgi:uncharacterized membrane protein